MARASRDSLDRRQLAPVVGYSPTVAEGMAEPLGTG